MSRFGIVVFPGSNCDRDCHDAVTLGLGQEAVYLWHDDRDLKNVDCVMLPGGFSYGDYLRSGAIACLSPIMDSVRSFAAKGGPVIGICNGFQILTEAGLLPGVLTRNTSLKFQCRRVSVTVENAKTRFTTQYKQGQVLDLPIAHADGNYYAEPDVVKGLEDNGQVVFRYADDVNGSVNRIAGITNEKGNVLGMMPHPERNIFPSQAWSGEGRLLFDSLLHSLQTVAV